MNKQQILAKIMLSLDDMGLVQGSKIKTHDDLLRYMKQLEMGLDESDLLGYDFKFLNNGFKEIRSGRAGVKDFYPSVPTFIAACTPKFEQYGLPTAQDAYNQASKLSSSHLKHTLKPLVYMAAMNHWAALGEGKEFKGFCKRYDSLFQKSVRGNLELVVPPVAIAKPGKKVATKEDKETAHNFVQDLIKVVSK